MKFSGGFFYVVTTNIAFSIRIMFYKKTVILKTTTGLSLYFQLVNRKRALCDRNKASHKQFDAQEMKVIFTTVDLVL